MNTVLSSSFRAGFDIVISSAMTIILFVLHIPVSGYKAEISILLEILGRKPLSVSPLIISKTSVILVTTWLIISRVNKVKITLLIGSPTPRLPFCCLFASYILYFSFLLLLPCIKLNKALWDRETCCFPALVPAEGKGSIIQGRNKKGSILVSV